MGEREKATLPSQPAIQAREVVESAAVVPNDPGNTAIVARVIDGDTIELDTGEKVRYIGVDTPERTHKPPDCYAQEATEKNRSLVEGKTVRLVQDVRNTDRYGRLLRFVYVNDVFVNHVLVAEGFARAFAVPPDISREEDFFLTEQTARSEQRGLWGDCDSDRLSIWEQTTGERAETAEFQATNSQPVLEDSPECYCEENMYDCKDFSSQAEAQALYDCCREKTGRDVHLIDGDNNSHACDRIK